MRQPWKIGRRPAGDVQNDESGLVIIWFALSFVGLLAFLAIVVESGLVFVERRGLQNTADAAALAGAQELFLNPAFAEFTAETYAATNTPDLVFNDAVVTGMQIRQEVRRNAPSGFSGVLSFGEPEVFATATARLAASRLPGPGVTCLGVEFETHGDALNDQIGVDLLGLDQAGIGPYLTILRLGAGQPNAGYVDITGSVNETTRECLANGSSNPLDPIEETQTGVATGQALQGLQERL